MQRLKFVPPKTIAAIKRYGLRRSTMRIYGKPFSEHGTLSATLSFALTLCIHYRLHFLKVLSAVNVLHVCACVRIFALLSVGPT